MTDSRRSEEHDEKEQEVWYERTRYQILLFAGGIALFGLVLSLILDWYIDPQNSTQKKDLVQALGLITAGVAGAVGIFFTWRGQRLAREAQENNQKNTQEQLSLSRQSQEQNQQSTRAQLDNAHEELRLTRQGQMTERFTQAVEQLGSDKLEIKLGGIYSLERTAQEEKNYHWPVMEVLTSHVRRRATRKPDKGFREDAATPERDIQAILDVIGRRSEYHRIDKDVEYGTIELNNTHLQGASLQKASLQRASLRGINLQGADLQGANLQGAILQGADLQGAILQGASLQRAHLYRANLQGAILQGSHLNRADLAGAILQGASFQGADLQGTSLQEADLQETNLQGVNSQGANLRGANLDEAVLQGANLQGAILQGASLQRAILYGADLQGAILYGADLQGAILQEAGRISENQIEWTLGSNATKLPEDLSRPELWSKSIEEQATIIRERFGD